MNEIEFLNEIELFGNSQIEQADEWGHSKDIYWFSNAMPKGQDVRFNGSKITDYYINDDYAKRTRWDLWNECIDYLKNNLNSKKILDIGGANGHFSFLCLKNGIEAYTVEPRIDMIRSTEKEFIENFGSKKSYCGNINTLLNTAEKHIEDIDFKFDCITILNFLHGKGHDLNDIKRLANLLPKITKYIIVSDPDFSGLGSENLFKDFEFVRMFGSENIHKLYKL